MKLLPITIKGLQSAVSLGLAVLLATYLAACSTVVKNKTEEVRLSVERAERERAAAEQAMAARSEEARRAAEEQAKAAWVEEERRAAEEQAKAAWAEAAPRAAAMRKTRKPPTGHAPAREPISKHESVLIGLTPNDFTPGLFRKTSGAQTSLAANKSATIAPVGTKSVSLRSSPLSLGDNPISTLESYSVTVSANEQLTIPGPPGELSVWIGISSKAPRIQPSMANETRELEAIGETAKVKPFALGIDVDQKESICEKIDPTGSEVRFKLTPIKTGVFTVGADIELYNSKDCTGTAIPKSAKSVTVHVTVDKERVASESIEELLKRAWIAFLNFWDKLLLIIFGLLIFFLRKKLYKLFRFENKE